MRAGAEQRAPLAELEDRARALLELDPASAELAARLPAGLVLLSRRPDRFVVAAPMLGAVFKVYRRRRGLAGLRERLFGDRAARASRRARLARARGLPVAEALLCVSGRAATALAMARVAPARTLREALSACLAVRSRRELARRAARLLAAVHAARIYPGDFHEGNVLVDAAGALHLIDPDGLAPVLWVSRRRRVRNLERLLRDFLGPHRVSRSLRRYFLAIYAPERARARGLWTAVARRSEEKRRAYGLDAP
jgi:tRNA A-37 threonylcarbamoyl transferase component Bud32